jgi:hypothetical protein
MEGETCRDKGSRSTPLARPISSGRSRCLGGPEVAVTLVGALPGSRRVAPN